MSPLLKLFVVIAVVALAACGKKAEELAAEKALESATGADVEISAAGESLVMESAYGDRTTMSTGDNARLPKGYPRDIYVPGDAAFNTTVVGGDGSLVTYTTGAAPSALYAKIRAEMTAKGWKEEVAAESAESSMLHYRKDARTVQYMINSENGMTAVTQTHATDPPGNPTE